jgi:peroxiredoxin
LRGVVETEDFGINSRTVVTIEYLKDGRKQETSTNRETVSAHLAILERLVEPSSRTSARIVRPHYHLAGAGGPRPPTDASLPLPDALTSLEAVEPPEMRAPELWRYLIGKPRTEEEARPIVEKLIEWTARPGQRDPYWNVSSLLNLDGRLRWRLPAGLRPAVFQAAAQLTPLARNADAEIPRLLQAMREEKVPLPPAKSPSVLAQFRLFELWSVLETRFDFSLPALDGTRRSIRSSPAKVIVLNLWATWCGPCRTEMPVLAAVHGNDVEVMAITDEPLDKVRGFVEKNPLGFTVLSDTERKTFKHYRTIGIPQTFVLDARRRLVKHFRDTVTEADLRAAIAASR